MKPTQASAAIAVTVLAMGALLASAIPSLSQSDESRADISGYCEKQFGADAFANIDRRDNGLLCSIRTDGGLGLTHNKIRAADICASQHGTGLFRREGPDLVCLGSTGDPSAQAERAVDLEAHCKKAHGPDAFPTTRRTDGRPMCTVRTDGGLGLQHHAIDTNQLCDGGPSRAEGYTLHCGRGATANQSGEYDPINNPGLQNGGADHQNGGLPFRHAAETKEAAEREVQTACKSVIPKSFNHFSPAPIPLGGDWKAATMETAAPLYQHYSNVMQEQRDWDIFVFTQFNGFYKRFAYDALMELLKCNHAAIRNAKYYESAAIKKSKIEACKIRDVLATIFPEPQAFEVESFKLALLEADQINAACGAEEEAKVIALRFVTLGQEKPTELDSIPYFEPIYIEVELDKEPEGDTREVLVEVESRSITLSAKRVAPALFRSVEPFMLAPTNGSPAVRP